MRLTLLYKSSFFSRFLRLSTLVTLLTASLQAAEPVPAVLPGVGDSTPVNAVNSAPAKEPTPASSKPLEASRQVVADPNLSVEVEGVADPAAIRGAVLRELGSHRERSGAPARVSVVLDETAQELHVLFQSGNGLPLERVVPAPPRALDIAELAALLAGNLARNDAELLLRELSPKVESVAPVLKPLPVEPPRAPLPYRPVNVSVFHPFSLLSDSEKDNVSLEMGLFYGRIGELSGLGLSASGLVRVDGTANGALIGGLAYWAGGDSHGLAVAGLFGGGGVRFSGLSTAGLALLQLGDVQGIQVAGLTSIAAGEVQGVQTSGLFNYSGALAGIQAAGLGNLAVANVVGMQAAGVANVDLADVQGIQAAGALNLVYGKFSGLQTAGIVNFASQLAGLQLSVVNFGGEVTGAQVGVLNFARKVTGTQIGLVNIAGSVAGASVGLVPYVQDGRVQLSVWYDRFQAVNLGVRLQNGILYFMPGGSFTPGGGGSGITTASGATQKVYFDAAVYAGFRKSFGPLYADLNGGISSPVVNNAAAGPIELRYRGLVGFQVLDKLGLFVGGGVRHRIPTGSSGSQEYKPTFCAGIDVL